MTEKITKKEMFMRLRKVVENDKELTDFIDHEIELLVKKNSAKKAPTKNQLENCDYKVAILNAMEADKSYCVSNIMALVGIPSNQRATALLTQLVNDNEIERFIEKRQARFKRV